MKHLLPLLLCISAWGQIPVGIIGGSDPPKTPTDAPGAGTYSSTQSVTLADATATYIMYSLSGTPACPATGTLYTGAFNISATSTLKAIGCIGGEGGGVLTSVYTISPVPALISQTPWATGTAQDVTSAALNTTGATLLIAYASGSGGILDAGTTVSSSPSNTWTKVVWSNPNDTPIGAAIAYAYVSLNNSSALTVTFHTNYSSPKIQVRAYSGTLTSGDPLDVQNHYASSQANGSIQPGSITPGANGELLVSIGCQVYGTTLTVDSGYGNNSTDIGLGLGVADQVQTTAAAINPTWTSSGAFHMQAGQAAFKHQ
jgi:hypothetical protein